MLSESRFGPADPVAASLIVLLPARRFTTRVTVFQILNEPVGANVTEPTAVPFTLTLSGRFAADPLA